MHYGLELANAAKSPFSYRQGFVTGLYPHPIACDFAANGEPNGFTSTAEDGNFFIWYVYAGPVPANGTRTVTLNYPAK